MNATEVGLILTGVAAVLGLIVKAYTDRLGARAATVKEASDDHIEILEKAAEVWERYSDRIERQLTAETERRIKAESRFACPLGIERCPYFQTAKVADAPRPE